MDKKDKNKKTVSSVENSGDKKNINSEKSELDNGQSTETKETKKTKEKEQIKKLKEEVSDLDGRLKRALADYQNLSKNVIQEKAEFAKYSLEGFFLEILPVFENLKMSINTLKEEDSKNPWVEGIKYVIKQFYEVFSNNGLEEIQTIGQKFDYNCMEAIEGQGEIVEKETRQGYKLKGKVIIPAKVILENSSKK